MKCAMCDSDLHYGDQYCNICGEKVPKDTYDADYAKTVWGRIDKMQNKVEKLTLKKFLDNWITKTVILLVILAVGFIDAYTDFTNIKFLNSESYVIEYNKKADEYYIRTDLEEVDLNLYIPKHAEKIAITEYKDDSSKMWYMLPEEYEKKAARVKKNEFDYMTISSVAKEKIKDTVKLYVTE